MIEEFQGQYRFLSNFYSCTFTYNGITYQSSEAAFQAQKVTDEDYRLKFSNLNPGEAKKLGRYVPLRSDWEEVKDDIMFEVVLAKFTSNSELQEKLLETGCEELVEGNTWGDQYWGKVNGVGQNKLGQILMHVRTLLKLSKSFKN